MCHVSFLGTVRSRYSASPAAAPSPDLPAQGHTQHWSQLQGQPVHHKQPGSGQLRPVRVQKLSWGQLRGQSPSELESPPSPVLTPGLAPGPESGGPQDSSQVTASCTAAPLRGASLGSSPESQSLGQTPRHPPALLEEGAAAGLGRCLLPGPAPAPPAFGMASVSLWFCLRVTVPVVYCI